MKLNGHKLLLSILVLLVISVCLGLISFFPVANAQNQKSVTIDDWFNLTSQETYRQGIGAFHGGENITILINQRSESAINFTLLTYGGVLYSEVSKSDMGYSFVAGEDYYEGVFVANVTERPILVNLQVMVQKPNVNYPFSWLIIEAKILFVASLALGVISFFMSTAKLSKFENLISKNTPYTSKNLNRLKYFILFSLIFWLLLIAVNSYPMSTFENWYTDSARNPYTSVLFTRVGFSVFDTPLRALSSSDSSLYKFVTWAEMPHLYPLGSIFLFLPFGAMLENGIAQTTVFKMEIFLFIIVAHACFYLFFKMYWKREIHLNPKEMLFKPFWKQDLGFILKALGLYLFYIVLIVYAANGQFDSVPFFFSLFALSMFVLGRDDWFLLFVAVSSTFKYQAGIFLFPLIILSLFRLSKGRKRSVLLKNKLLLVSMGLFLLNSVTAYLSAPFLTDIRPELVMNGVNAFSPHAQLPWSIQALVVLLTLGVTIVCSMYLLNKSPFISFAILFSLFPLFIMPYFQPWYLPFFFIYSLIPQSKRSIEVTMTWLVFIVLVLSFGGLSYNPVAILGNIARILGF